ncbi:MAG: hypothetical protein HY791_01355 [Deltaproteobacteria bacterium]|nr:hypothetical protein [Deltaproteobacteria bacterium]
MYPSQSAPTFARAFERLIQPGVFVLRAVARAPNRWLELPDEARARSLKTFALCVALIGLSMIMGHWRGVPVGLLAFVLAALGISSERPGLTRWALRLAAVVAAIGLWDWCFPLGGNPGYLNGALTQSGIK